MPSKFKPKTMHRPWNAAFSPTQVAGPELTLFDLEVQRLQLQPAEWQYSQTLRSWAKANRKKHYIPEALLLAWGMQIGEREMNLCA
jgi:hypothetical protein